MNGSTRRVASRRLLFDASRLVSHAGIMFPVDAWEHAIGTVRIRLKRLVNPWYHHGENLT